MTKMEKGMLGVVVVKVVLVIEVVLVGVVILK
jgi:hypothetical protein